MHLVTFRRGRGEAKPGAVWHDAVLDLIGLSRDLAAQSGTLKYEVDPAWPKPLPENWVTGQVSGVCVDGQDHVFIVNRNDMTSKEAEVSQQAPPFIEFDADGRVVNSFGDWKTERLEVHMQGRAILFKTIARETSETRGGFTPIPRLSLDQAVRPRSKS